MGELDRRLARLERWLPAPAAGPDAHLWAAIDDSACNRLLHEHVKAVAAGDPARIADLDAAIDRRLEAIAEGRA